MNIQTAETVTKVNSSCSGKALGFDNFCTTVARKAMKLWVTPMKFDYSLRIMWVSHRISSLLYSAIESATQPRSLNRLYAALLKAQV